MKNKVLDYISTAETLVERQEILIRLQEDVIDKLRGEINILESRCELQAQQIKQIKEELIGMTNEFIDSKSDRDWETSSCSLIRIS